MSLVLASLHSYIVPLHTPIHPYVPFAPLDIFGAIRLSQAVYWITSGALDEQPSDEPGAVRKTSKKRTPPAKGPSVLQECLGILVVLFGGETFIAVCTRTPPSWLLSSKITLLFALTLQTRTSLRRYIPGKPTLGLELLLSIPDAIGRTLLLTRFSLLPLLHRQAPFKNLPATPVSLILVPFILAAPFAALSFSGANLFSSDPIMSIPRELRPSGWLSVDAWLPLVIPMIFCGLVGPVLGWDIGIKLSEDEAIVACGFVVTAAFVGRTVHNLSGEA